MGQKSSTTSPLPIIQFILFGRKLNVYSIPESYYDFESIGYSFYYAYTDQLTPFEYLNFTFSSHGFIKQTFTITNKKTFKKAMKYVINGPVQIIIQPEM